MDKCENCKHMAEEMQLLREKIAEQDRLIESIGAGGVSGQRITGGKQ